MTTSKQTPLDKNQTPLAISLPKLSNLVPNHTPAHSVISGPAAGIFSHQKLVLPARVFKKKTEIKPWLQQKLASQGISIVIERSDDSKIVFKCKNGGCSLKNGRKYIKRNPKSFSKKKNGKSGCPFRIRANYSLRARNWSLVIINDCHNHPVFTDQKAATVGSPLPSIRETFGNAMEIAPVHCSPMYPMGRMNQMAPMVPLAPLTPTNPGSSVLQAGSVSEGSESSQYTNSSSPNSASSISSHSSSPSLKQAELSCPKQQQQQCNAVYLQISNLLLKVDHSQLLGEDEKQDLCQYIVALLRHALDTDRCRGMKNVQSGNYSYSQPSGNRGIYLPALKDSIQAAAMEITGNTQGLTRY